MRDEATHLFEISGSAEADRAEMLLNAAGISARRTIAGDPTADGFMVPRLDERSMTMLWRGRRWHAASAREFAIVAKIFRRSSCSIPADGLKGEFWPGRSDCGGALRSALDRIPTHAHELPGVC